jgi:ribosomal protein S18 acetylase RimI-like enzyme
MSTLIRHIKEKDLFEVCNLMFELTGHEISERDMKNRMDFVRSSNIDDLYVCEVDGKVQGVLGFRIRENIEEVSRFGEISVIVASSCSRRLGIGKAMMEYAEMLAKEKGCIGTWLVTDLDREEEAHRFYKSLGYKINGYRFIKPFKEA